MKNVILGLVFALSALVGAGEDTFLVQFSKSETGRMVTVCIGGKVETTFAGKLLFRDANTSRLTVCGDVRTPISHGQYGYFKAIDTAAFVGNIRKAGNIVAKYFNEAQTPQQCAGLQIAIWEALEDGGAEPNFLEGKFQVQAEPVVIAYAQKFYDGVNSQGHAVYFQSPTTASMQNQIAPVQL